MALSKGEKAEIVKMIGAAQRAVSSTPIEAVSQFDLGQVAEDAAENVGSGSELMTNVQYILTYTTTEGRFALDIRGEIEGSSQSRRFYFPPNGDAVLEELKRVQAGSVKLEFVSIAASDEEYTYTKGAEITNIRVGWYSE